jgi:hypothetical protein
MRQLCSQEVTTSVPPKWEKAVFRRGSEEALEKKP